LFVRGRRPAQPTLLAQQLAIQGRAILAASRKASEAVLGFQKGTKGLVRVAGVPFFMDAFISRMIAEFQNEEPDVSVQQGYGNLPEMQAALEAGELDLAIVPMAQREAPRGFEFLEILPGRNIVACRPVHPLMRKRRLQVTDLAEYPWVAPLPGSPLLADLHAILLAIGMSDLNIRYAGGSLMSVMNYLSDTDGLAVLPHSVVFAARKENRVTVLPFDIPQPARSLGILRRISAPRPIAADRFAQHIAHAFEDLRHLIKRHENAVVWGR
ncbi:MAG: substrate-binding domain-containing protein, partial [Gemmobacter sp.]